MKALVRARTLRRVTAMAAAGVVVAASLAACTSGTGTETAGSPSSISDALEAGGTITYWTWTGHAEDQVAAFEKAYPNVNVEVVNAGTGTTQYTKLENAIKAGSGAPDVAQIEYAAVPQFALADSLVDLAPYGFDELKDSYTAGPWNSVSIGGKLVGLPQDSGPTAMFYNKTVFDKYGIEVPTTWDEYVAAAEKLHSADPETFITNDSGDPDFTTAMIWQAGGRPFKVDGTTVSIDLQDEGTKKWTATWNKLVENRLLSPTVSWTDEWFKSLGNGTIATLVTGAWMSGVLESSVPEGSGQWRVAPIPSYDGTPTNSENGGSADVVLAQSKHAALAAGFVKWLNSDPASISIFLDAGGFPSTVADLNSPEFVAPTPEYFGGQAINEVLVDGAGNVTPGWQYLPFQVYANSVYGDTVGQAYASYSDLNPGLQAWEDNLVDYGSQQGFTMTDE